MKKIYTTMALTAITLVSFTAAALAAGAVVPADGSLIDLFKPIYEAMMGRHWWLGGSLTLVFCVAVFKKCAPAKWQEWSNGDVGGAVLVLVGSFGGALATGLLAIGTDAVTLALAWTALKVALGAAGGYSLIKKLLGPIAAKAPLWMQPVLNVLLWMFNSSPAIVKAEEAGKAAVAAAPGAGVVVIVGEFTEIK